LHGEVAIYETCYPALTGNKIWKIWDVGLAAFSREMGLELMLLNLCFFSIVPYSCLMSKILFSYYVVKTEMRTLPCYIFGNASS
jgi:hypothetical protein